MIQQNGELERQLYKAGIIALLICSILGYVYLQVIVPKFSPPCAIYTLTGFYCPGCGGTRAVGELLHGHLLRSLWYHPLVPYAAMMFVGFMGTQTLARLHLGRIKGWSFHNWYLWTALAIIIINWIVKNILLFGFGIMMK